MSKIKRILKNEIILFSAISILLIILFIILKIIAEFVRLHTYYI